MKLQLPPPRHRNWLLFGIIGSVGTALVVIVFTRLLTAGRLGTLTELLQAWVASSLFFSLYFALVVAAGYFALNTMLKVLLGGLGLAIVALFYFAWRDTTGWGGLAAIAAFIQVIVLAVAISVLSELGRYVWELKQ